MAVIAAFKLQNEIALGEAAGEANGAHGGFGAAGNEANLFDERNRRGDQRCEFQFKLGSDAKAGAAFRLIGNGGGDTGICVAQDQRAPRAHVVEQLVAIRVVQVLARTTFDDQRLAADGAERAHGAIHAADEDLFGAFENLARPLAVAFQGWWRRAHLGMK